MRKGQFGNRATVRVQDPVDSPSITPYDLSTTALLRYGCRPRVRVFRSMSQAFRLITLLPYCPIALLGPGYLIPGTRCPVPGSRRGPNTEHRPIALLPLYPGPDGRGAPIDSLFRG
jgi:hypothetical protein